MPQNGNARKVFFLGYSIYRDGEKTKKYVYTREKKYEISRTVVKGKGKRKKAPAIFFRACCERGA